MKDYYARFQALCQKDAADLMAVTPLADRDHKKIKLLLDMAADCESKAALLTGETDYWAKVSPAAQEQIMAILELDKENEHGTEDRTVGVEHSTPG